VRFIEENRTEGVQIDITPIVDTVFNLMIFFALSMNFMLNPGIKVDLPESSVEEIVQKEKEVTVSITKEGEVMVDSTPVDFEQLFDELKKISEKNPQAIIVIQADRNVTHGRVVQIMDIARSSGIKRIAISTQFKPRGK
jgi:biopolymer transport protein ExbD